MAYVEAMRGQRIAAEGDVERGIALMDSAANRVPEVPELALLPNILKAQLLARDEPEEAIRLLDASERHAPPEWQESFRRTRAAAEQSIAFDRQDYDTFLAKSQELAEQYPQDPFYVASAASAFACKYAVTGDPAMRDEALEKLAEAKALAEPEDPNFQEYEARIRHRLHTREIITAEEFHKRFPTGWTEENGE